VAWGPAAVAATALAGLLVAVPLIGLLSIGGDKGASPETVALAAPTTAAAAREESIPPDAAPAEAGTGPGDDLAGDNEADPQYSVVAPEITTTAAAATTIATSLRRRPDGEAILVDFLDAPDQIEGLDEGGDACNAEARALLGGDEARAAIVSDDGSTAVIWFTSAGDGSIDRVLVYDAADCSLLATGP